MPAGNFNQLGLGYQPFGGDWQMQMGGGQGFGGGGGIGGMGPQGMGNDGNQFGLSMGQKLAGVTVDPFTGAFANSFNTMNGLGGYLGSAFGAINSANQAADQANQDRDLKRNMFQTLAQLLGQYNNRPGVGAIRFGDTNSRQSAG